MEKQTVQLSQVSVFSFPQDVLLHLSPSNAIRSSRSSAVYPPLGSLPNYLRPLTFNLWEFFWNGLLYQKAWALDIHLFHIRKLGFCDLIQIPKG